MELESLSLPLSILDKPEDYIVLVSLLGLSSKTGGCSRQQHQRLEPMFS